MTSRLLPGETSTVEFTITPESQPFMDLAMQRAGAPGPVQCSL